MKTAEQIKGAIRNISKENKLQRKNLEFFRFKIYRQNKRIIVAVL